MWGLDSISKSLCSSSVHHPLFSPPYPWGSCLIFWVKKNKKVPQLPLSAMAKAIVLAEFFRFHLVFA